MSTQPGAVPYTHTVPGKGKYYVQAGPGTASTVKVKVKSGKVAKKNITVKDLTTVTGTVTHGSVPVRGIIVEAVALSKTGCIHWGGGPTTPNPPKDCIEWFLAEATTDENGRFSLPDVPLGALHIQVRDVDDGGYQTVLKKFKITDGADLTIEALP